LYDLKFLKCVDYLSVPVGFISKFDFGERHWLLHPVCPEVWGLGMDINRVRRGRFGLAAGDPLPVHVLPPVALDLDEFE